MISARFFRIRQRGDTILEVMICVAVIGMLLAAAFALSSRNTTAELKAQERSTGVKIAETQLELFKSYADLHKLPNTDAFFCMVPDDSTATGVRLFEFPAVATPNPDREADLATNYPVECQQQEPAFAYEFVIWSPNRSGQVGGAAGIPYAVTVRWDAAGGGERQEVKFFYTLYDGLNPGITVTGDPPDLCANGIDDDGDGAIDFPADTGCVSDQDNDEINPQCNDGIDNDGDGTVDHPGDRGCSNLQDNSESPDPPFPLNFTVDGSGYSACVVAEGVWNDGLDGCFKSGSHMFAWREVRVTYPTPGLTPGQATLEIKYQEHHMAAPAGYNDYNLDLVFAGSTSNINLPVASPGVQMTHLRSVNIPESVPTDLILEWKNNNGDDPDLRIDSIRIYR